MQMDLPVAAPHRGKFRRDFGLDRLIGLHPKPLNAGERIKNALAQRGVRRKVANFIQTAIYPQQLTVPRQYATTQEGVFIYKILKGRDVSGFREDGVRVVVQENLKAARFVMSPLFSSEYDALQWAKRQMGVQL